MKKTTYILLCVALAILGIWGWLYAGGMLPTLSDAKRLASEVALYEQAHPVNARLAYFIVYIGVAAACLPGVGLLTVLGGAAFGFVHGLVLASFASSIGAALAFLGARHVMGATLLNRHGSHVQKLTARFAKEGPFFLFALRLVPCVPFFLINLAFSLTPIRLRQFYCISQVGMLPATAVYVYAGGELGKLRSMAGVLSPDLLLAFLLLGAFPFLAKYGLNHWLAHRGAR